MTEGFKGDPEHVYVTCVSSDLDIMVVFVTLIYLPVIYLFYCFLCSYYDVL